MTRRCNLFLLTAARDLADPWQYLKATVAGIEAQGACVTYRAIICDGVYDGPRFGGWDIISYLGKQPDSGNRDAWFRVFHVAQDVTGDALCLEDDIEIAPGGLRRMLDFDIPGELGFVQFFGSKAYINAKTPPGLRRAPRGTSRFLQATKYTRECLSMLDSFRNRPEYQETPHSADQTIAKACKIQHIDHAIHVPSLVQHVGAVSKNTPTAKLAWWRQADPAAVALGLRETDPTLYR